MFEALAMRPSNPLIYFNRTVSQLFQTTRVKQTEVKGRMGMRGGLVEREGREGRGRGGKGGEEGGRGRR